MTDNGSCYQSFALGDTCRDARIISVSIAEFTCLTRIPQSAAEKTCLARLGALEGLDK
jgi:hypothetical protein